MIKVILTVGLPASGKSSWAREYQSIQEKVKIVSKDNLREMLDCGRHTPTSENFILKVRNSIILEAIKNRFNIVVDDTNLNPIHLKSIQKLVEDFNKNDDYNDYDIKVETKFFNVPLEECIKRDSLREKSVGEKVIRDMYNKYIDKWEDLKLNTPNKNLPKAIMVDIDGTVAKNVSRGFFDWHRVSEDYPHDDIINLVKIMRNQGYNVIFVSGRDGVCFVDTKNWLERYFNVDDGFRLFMRTEGDNRPDEVIKKEIYYDRIIHNYYIEYVLDDRNKVVKMWRDIGLRVLQVADGDF